MRVRSPSGCRSRIRGCWGRKVWVGCEEWFRKVKIVQPPLGHRALILRGLSEYKKRMVGG